jgi:phage tail sheath protein FI
MPSSLTYPGVYIEEVPSGVRTIMGVSTSIAAFLGRTSKGPVNKAVRILSYADYERSFGSPYPKSDVAQSVQLFFQNGGTDCYVIRLARNAKPASVTLENLNGDPVLAVTAKAEGGWGNTVRLQVDYNTANPDETFNLRIIYEEDGTAVKTENFIGLSMDPDSARFAPDFVTSSSELIKLALDPAVASGGANDLAALANSFGGYSQSRRPLGLVADVRNTLNNLINAASPQSRFQISVDGTAYVDVDLGPWSGAEIGAATLNDVMDRFEDRINTALDSVSPTVNVAVTWSSPAGLDNLLTITSGAGLQSDVRIRRATSRDISAALMLGVDQGGIEPVRYSNFRPAPTASLLRIGDPAAPGSLGTLNAVSALAANAITSLSFNGVAIPLNAAPYNLQTTAGPADPWFRNATGASTATGDNDGVREKLRIIANAITNNASLNYRAEVWGYTLAIIATGGTLNEIPSSLSTGVVAFDSGLILNTRQFTLGAGGSSAFSIGTDGINGIEPDADAYKGSESEQTGFHALDPVDLFNLMILPGDEEVTETTMASLWGPASVYCQRRRAFLLVDPPSNWTDASIRPKVVQDTSLINTLRATLVTENSAVFYPRLKINDEGVSRLIAPAGAIAGLMARTDSNRGVWKAAAGLEAGLRSILGLELTLTDAENGVLNKKGANCIRVFPSGITNWGARTLAGDDDLGSEWKYIPIRRFALFLEESLFRGTRWAVFEPNDEPLWANLRLNINAFMFSLFRQGAFQGTSPQEAYYVKCDKETTTQDDRNKGIVNIEVGFAPLKPAEFIVIKIQQMAGKL